MDYILSPSLLAADYSALGAEVAEAQAGGAQWLHIDVMDGMFVPNISFGPPAVQGLRPVTDIFFDVHLMVQRPERYIDNFLSAGADLICVHLEATDVIEEIAARVHAASRKFAIALKPGTPADAIRPYLALCDMVLVMTVEPGFGGQRFMADMLPKIEEIRAMRTEAGYDFDIEVDGGLTLEHLAKATGAGANVIVAGSAVFQKGRTAENARAFMRAFAQL